MKLFHKESDNPGIEITELYVGVTLKASDTTVHICERDGGYEFTAVSKNGRNEQRYWIQGSTVGQFPDPSEVQVDGDDCADPSSMGSK